MDHIDTKILRCLAQDARMNASQISAQVNLSVSAVIERMKKLEASGYKPKKPVKLKGEV